MDSQIKNYLYIAAIQVISTKRYNALILQLRTSVVNEGNFLFFSLNPRKLTELTASCEEKGNYRFSKKLQLKLLRCRFAYIAEEIE